MVKDIWTYSKKRKKRPIKQMSRTIATQTSPEKFIPQHWNPNVLLERLQMANTVSENSNNDENTQEIPPQVEKDPTEESSTLTAQFQDVPKAVSRLPNNYTVFIKPITNNSKANSTLTTNSTLTNLRSSNITTRARIGPKCYKLLHERFDAEFEIPLVRDDNGDKSLNNSLTIIHEQEEAVGVEPQPEMDLSMCENTNELEEVLNMTDILDVENVTDMDIDEAIREHPREVELNGEPEVVNEEINEERPNTNTPHAKTTSSESENNLNNDRRKKTKTVTFELDEEDGDTEQDVPIRKRKYIRIFADKVNIYNHFYN